MEQPHSQTSVPFGKIFTDGVGTVPMRGDRFIYDQRNGTLMIYRDDAEIAFQSNTGDFTRYCFVGRDWSRELTRASAELYARMGGLKGLVVPVEGSFQTLLTFEILD